MLKRAAVSLAVLVLSSTASAQNTEGADHTDLYFTPQQETPTDYTKGSVRLGTIPGQDLVVSLGGNGLPLGDFKASKPANATVNAADAPITHLRNSRQTVALDRDLDTGIPIDTVSNKVRGLSEYLQSPAEREATASAALNAYEPR